MSPSEEMRVVALKLSQEVECRNSLEIERMYRYNAAEGKIEPTEQNTTPDAQSIVDRARIYFAFLSEA